MATKGGLSKQFGGMLQMSQPSVPNVKAPSLTGSQQTSVKAPKPKKMADPFATKSQFFKSECEPKHPNLQKLADFIAKKYKK